MIPAHSTTIRIEGNSQDDPDEDAEWGPEAEGVRAHIVASARPGTVGGQVIDAELWADPCPITLATRVVDERSGETYTPVSVLILSPLQGLHHVRAGLIRVAC